MAFPETRMISVCMNIEILLQGLKMNSSPVERGCCKSDQKSKMLICYTLRRVHTKQATITSNPVCYLSYTNLTWRKKARHLYFWVMYVFFSSSEICLNYLKIHDKQDLINVLRARALTDNALEVEKPWTVNLVYINLPIIACALSYQMYLYSGSSLNQTRTELLHF